MWDLYRWQLDDMSGMGNEVSDVENCDTCAYQTSRWKVCTNKRKRAKVNQELLKEKGHCYDYIGKDILFSNFKATRYMYDGIFVSEAIDAARDANVDTVQKLERAEARLRLKEEWSIKDVESFFVSLEKCLKVIFGGRS